MTTLHGAPVGIPLVLGDPTGTVKVRRRLAELGLRHGRRVTVISRSAGGGRIVDVAGSRIALDAATADALPVTAAGNATTPLSADTTEAAS